MSDLSARLREEGLGFGIGPAGLCQEAAQEIDVLRAQLEASQASELELQDKLEECEEKLMAFAASEARLREALGRLGSSETMTLPFMIAETTQTGKELQARLQYARDAFNAIEPSPITAVVEAARAYHNAKPGLELVKASDAVRAAVAALDGEER